MAAIIANFGASRSSPLICWLLLSLGTVGNGVLSEEPVHEPSVLRHLQRDYDVELRAYRFREDYPGGFHQWQREAREALKELVGLPEIAQTEGGHKPVVELGAAEEVDGYLRQSGTILTEPDVKIPFWLLRPQGHGPFPLVVTPHGHTRKGYEGYAGVYRDEKHRRKALGVERDVAVQAVRHGFLAIAPATRGLGAAGVPDIFGRHGKRDCRSQLMHCLLSGRTPTGERVWDLQRILDWAIGRDDVDARTVVMMGNSGGGMATLYAAAIDPRISIAIPSCSFSLATGRNGRIYHCDCIAVPGIYRFGELFDVAGLIAPRYLLTISGRHDGLHDNRDVQRAASQVERIYKASGYVGRYEHRWGTAGHRFYSDLMWPFVEQAMKSQ